jgi:tetratricopeptide (TPR) repeat protein
MANAKTKPAPAGRVQWESHRAAISKLKTVCLPAARLLALIFLLSAGILLAGQAQREMFLDRARAAFQRAQDQFAADTNNVAAAVQLARAGFDFADRSTNDTTRAAVARQAIAVCRRLVAEHPRLAAGHYYLALNLAELARTEWFGALKLVKEMEREFKQADELDPHLDYAGPSRGLGLLYRDAPGWPASIGSRHKARQWLERAVQLAPDFPENRLCLAESYLKWNEPARAQEELNALDALWPRARTNFVGAAWAPDWDDWTTRRDDARKRLMTISAPVRSPRNER